MVWAMHFYLKLLTLKKEFLNYNAKALSVTMIAKNEKIAPKISYSFIHFSEM